MDAKTDIDPLLECLLVLSAFHGNTTTRESLVSGLPLEQTHLPPSLFERAAAHAGLAARIVSKPLDQLSSRTLPAVLLLEGGDACVLRGWESDRDAARVTFPELPDVVEVVSRQELGQLFSGRVIYVRPLIPDASQASPEKVADSRHWFWGVMRANLSVYRDVLVAAFFINLFALTLPLFAMNVYDRVVPNNALETLWALALGVGIVLLGDLLLRSLRIYFLELASKKADMVLSARLMAQVLGLKMMHSPRSVGAFAANLRAYEAIRDFTTSASLTGMIDLPFTLVFLAVLGWIAPVLVLPLLVGICVVLLAAWIMQRKMRALSESVYSATAERNGILIETLVGLSTLKILNAEGRMQRRWEQAAALLNRVAVRLRLLAGGNLNLAVWVQQLVNVSIIVIGVYLIIAGQLTLGGLIAATMLSNRAMAPISQVAGLMMQYHGARTALLGLNEMMSMPGEHAPEQHYSSPETFKGQLQFRHTSFNYPGSDLPALNDLSFSVQPGERVAVLGRVGSGKTTVHRLLMGLYEAQEGAVLLDGIDIRQLDPTALRHHLAYVPQDVTLFQGSLRDNLLMAAPHASQPQLEEVVRMANLHQFVHAHPQGFDMLVGERGEALSGGQRKAVALARALLRNPSVLLLDEATGEMDPVSESAIVRNLQTLPAAMTLLFTTHRTAMIALAQRVVVVDGGQVIADGPREKVMDALRKGRIKGAQ